MKRSRNTNIEVIIKKNVEQIGRAIQPLGFRLDHYQPHISGERKRKSLTKLVLLGIDGKNNRVVIKASNKPEEIKKIRLEKKVRDELEMLAIASPNLLLPKEIFFGKRDGWLFFIMEFVEQAKILSAHHPSQQIRMLKNLIRAMEQLDINQLNKAAPGGVLSRSPQTSAFYVKELTDYIRRIKTSYPNPKLLESIRKAGTLFNRQGQVIDKFGSNLIHEDLCPHNFRINNKKLYLLDFSSVAAGNKYATWARLFNYLCLHEPNLEKELIRHLEQTRSRNDLECLRIFRIYKTVFLIMYYAEILPQTSGKLAKLTKIRIGFWHNFLDKLLENKRLTQTELSNYINQRNALRTPEEKKRQKEFAIA